MASRPIRSLGKRVAFSALALVLALLAMEATLWLVGFEYRPGSITIYDEASDQRDRLRRSAELGWELEPGQAGANEDGFIGERIPKERSPGRLRIAALGDSCTQFGDPPYIERAADLLTQRLGRPVESLNAGVSGYSTHQGLLRWKRDVAPYSPDVVVIYFGWNDHWVAQGVTDGGRLAQLQKPSTQFLWAIDRSRLVQAAFLVADELSNSNAPTYRVPIPEYEANLRELINNVQSSGAAPIVVTAPTSATPDTPWGAFSHLPATLSGEYSSPFAVHQEYVEATRRVAKQTGAHLVDAAEDFTDGNGLMRADHIHPTEAGYQRLAELIAPVIESAVN